MTQGTWYSKDGAAAQFVDASELTTALNPYAKTADLPSKTSDLTNDSAFITSTDLNGYVQDSSNRLVPAGGASGQILAKSGGGDYETGWIDAPSGGTGSVASSDITDATTVGKAVLTAADAAAARTAIGAGTSDLALGTTSGTALAGDTTIPSTASDVSALADTWPSTSLVSSTLTAFGSLEVPIVYDDANSTWPTLNTWMSQQANVVWHFIGGTEATPPPTTIGQAYWDRPA